MPAIRLVVAGLVLVTLAGGAAVPSPASAQARGQGGDGYLLGTPRGVVVIRGGFARPNASSEVFAFASEQLTVDKGDFASAAFAIEAGVLFVNRVEALFSVGVAGRTVNSNYRNLVDNDDAEIRQTTTFRRVPVTLGARLYLTPPGRSLGNYAWVPSRVAPYVSAGVGGVFYRFRQQGDFVDFRNLDVFNATVQSSGWGATGYGAAGMLFSLVPRASLMTEVRYDAARAPMYDGFYEFKRIDLSGTSASAGIQLRF